MPTKTQIARPRKALKIDVIKTIHVSHARNWSDQTESCPSSSEPFYLHNGSFGGIIRLHKMHFVNTQFLPGQSNAIIAIKATQSNNLFCLTPLWRVATRSHVIRQLQGYQILWDLKLPHSHPFIFVQGHLFNNHHSWSKDIHVPNQSHEMELEPNLIVGLKN